MIHRVDDLPLPFYSGGRRFWRNAASHQRAAHRQVAPLYEYKEFSLEARHDGPTPNVWIRRPWQLLIPRG